MYPGSKIILLGDVKGTKYHLTNNLDKALSESLWSIHNSFSNAFLSFFERSRNLHCYTLSDSVIARWDNELEGIQYCIPFALKFWQGLGTTPYRIFIDSGKEVSNPKGHGELLTNISGRYHNTLPVSFPLWSVSSAESNHFPVGIFVGKQLADRLGAYSFEGDFLADCFNYKKLSTPPKTDCT